MITIKKHTNKAILMAVCAVLCSCAYQHKPTPKNNGVARHVSPDYIAIGAIDNINAYIIGTRTVIELDKSNSLSVQDTNGVNVEYERVGQHYRLAHALDSFTVTTGGQAVKFASTETMKTTVFSANSKTNSPVILQAESKPINTVTLDYKPVMYSNQQAMAVLNLAQIQINEVKEALATAKTNNQVNEAIAKLDLIEGNLKSYTATVFANYKSYDTRFKLDEKASNILLDAAKIANSVKITGYTNSKNGGALEAKIALKRSENARDYLIKNGVPSDKITTFSVATGDFIAPNTTKKGGLLNRRVEIELAMPHYETSTTQKI